VDAELAAQVRRWGALSITKTEQAIDALVDRHDPGALRRSRDSESSRTLEFGSSGDAPGITSMWARMYAPDAALIQQRVEEMARSVCEADPRTLAERRADALVALAAGAELVCACGSADCPAAGRATPPKNTVIHVVADPATVTAATQTPTPAPTDTPAPPPTDPGDPGDPGGESAGPADTVEPAAESVEPGAESVEPAAPSVEPIEPAAESVEPVGESVQLAAAGHSEVPAAFLPAPGAQPIASAAQCEPAIPQLVIAPAHTAAGPLIVPLAQCQPGIALPVIDASNLKVGGPQATPVPPPSCPAPPAFVIGGGVLPAPLLAGVLARATIREVRHPGIDAPPETRYRASRELSDFVRCRDLTCRWPGCDKPSYQCDLDHTVPYPVGPTHASNVKCYCRFHHLLKTFYCGAGGWRERQLPDGTLTLTSPTGHTYTTHPGSKLLFPSLCAPTGELWRPGHEPTIELSGDRGAMMPKRRHPRAHNRQRAIEAERRLNDEYVAERNKPPPF
jgi:hypothetical protein